MNRFTHKLIYTFVCIAILLAGGWHLMTVSNLNLLQPGDDRSEKLLEKQAKRAERIKSKAARAEYYFRMLRDPETNRIPRDVRAKELAYAAKLPSRSSVRMKLKGKATSGFEWRAAGPFDVGGRTRALGLDRRNPDNVIAGGVSGGIWKSTNNGSNWTFATETDQNLSVTSLAQDPTSPNTWYYASGEFSGNTPADRGFTAPYFGSGVYKSTNNGTSWQRIAVSLGPNDNNPTQFDNPLDFVSRIVASPTTGSIFISSNGFGIYRSTDDGDSFEHVAGTMAEQIYSDIAVGTNGTLVATFSEASFEANSQEPNNPGVFYSTDDGNTWTDVTPTTFPNSHQRSVVAIAPSDPDIAYILTYSGGTGESEDVRFHYLDLGAGTSEDRSDNLPDFGGEVGYMSTQANYNMTVAVKPDNPNFVLVGGINLFRSRDGFATQPAGGYDNSDQDQKNEYWIGGYDNANDISTYPNQHADQHVIAFDPTDANRVWVGHDGGLSVTNDITASRVTWTDKNNDYVTTQFYTTDIPDAADENRVIGGTQDNGTIFFRNGSNGDQIDPAVDVSSGDGGYAYFTQSFIFVSRQEGSIIRYNTSSSGNPASPYAFVHPSSAENQLFIHPYVVDPTNESIMYYPAGNTIWRNTRVNLIVNQDSDGARLASGWEELANISAPSGYTITTLEASTNPANTLYYGAYADDGIPKLYKLLNASSATDGQLDISIPEDQIQAGMYVHDIAVNPNNANEILVVFSNYNVKSVWHTINGGTSWSPVEGNLAGNTTGYGPSVRSASIIPAEEGTIYAVGTSTGLYSTTALDGETTQWVQESPDDIGYAVTEYVTSRPSDGTLAAGTHGRGVFLGDFTGEAVGPEPAEQFALNPNFPNPASTITNISFDLPARSRITITLYDIQGRKIADILNGEERPAFKGLVEPINLQSLNLASGVYLYRFEADPLQGYEGIFWDTGKITYVK